VVTVVVVVDVVVSGPFFDMYDTDDPHTYSILDADSSLIVMTQILPFSSTPTARRAGEAQYVDLWTGCPELCLSATHLFARGS